MKKVTEQWQYYHSDRVEKILSRRSKKSKYVKYRKSNRSEKRKRYKSKIIDMLNNSDLQAPVKKSYATIYLPIIFSIIDNPVESLQAIHRLLKVSRYKKRKIHGIKVDHSRVMKIDLAAETILDYILLEIQAETKSTGRRFSISGKVPKNTYLSRYIRAVGIIKNLQIKHEYLPSDEEELIDIFLMRNKKAAAKLQLGSLDYKEKVIKDFVDHINSCLLKVNRRLKEESMARLAEYTGEIVDNAEEYSGITDWNIVGYYDALGESQLCEIVIFNFGKTIADTFKELNKNSFAYNNIDNYLKIHSSRNLDDLLTVVSLQGDISSKNQSNKGTRGQGTVEMIKFFQKIHDECGGDNDSCARMSIVSGSSCVYLDGTYRMEENENNRNIIAFNSNNSLLDPPDDKFVNNMGELYFSGTIISIRFRLGIEQTEEVS